MIGWARAGRSASCQLAAVLAVILQAAAAPALASEAVDVGAVEALVTERLEGEAPGGAVFVMVSGGEVVSSLGFGFVDAAGSVPVDAGSTLFYVGSVTKVFTATSALQMVSSGRLELDGDVNERLDGLQIPATWPEPVTLRHLLTHTAGFEDRNIGYVARTEGEARPLADYLASALPARARPPGTVHAYSNHGYGLIGMMLESVAGESYAQILRERIFDPLEMSSTTARVPPAPPLRERMAQGFQRDARTGIYEAVPLGFRNIPPAGSVSTTGSDMARFMMALLGDGSLEDGRILDPEAARRMRERLWSPRPDVPGMAFGLFEREQGDLRLLEHRGVFLGFSSHLLLAPSEGLGIFMATSRNPGGLSSLVQELLDLLHPLAEAPGTTTSSAAGDGAHGADAAGLYFTTRSSRSTIEKIALFDNSARVSVDPVGRLVVVPRNQGPSVYLPAGEKLYRSEDRRRWLVFQDGGAGEPDRICISGDGIITALERASWMEDLRVQLPLMLGMMAFALSALLLWPLRLAAGAWLHHRRGTPAPRDGRRLAAAAAVAAGLVQLTMFLGIDATLGYSGYRLDLIYGMTGGVKALLWLNLLAALLSLGLAPLAVRCWRRRFWTVGDRLYYSVLALSGLAFAGFMANWNLLGFLY